MVMAEQCPPSSVVGAWTAGQMVEWVEPQQESVDFPAAGVLVSLVWFPLFEWDEARWLVWAA